MSKKGIIFAVIAVVLILGGWYLQNAGGATSFVWKISDGGKFLLPLLAVSALIDSINPCAFSALLLTIAFLFSIGSLKRKIFAVGGFYILGLFAAYLLIGLGILQALHIFNTPHFMAKLGAFLLIALGVINLINHFFPRFPIKLKIPDAAHRGMAILMEKASLPTAFLLGALVGLCEFPCTGGPYLMVLGLLHDQVTYFSGFGYLVLYNLIFVLPLIVILFVASDGKLVEKVDVWRKAETSNMRLITGIAMVVLGLIIFLF